MRTGWPEQVPMWYVACVAKGIGAVRKEGGPSGKRRTHVDEVSPIGIGRTAARAVRRTSPPIMGDVRGVHSMRAQNIGKKLAPECQVVISEARASRPAHLASPGNAYALD